MRGAIAALLVVLVLVILFVVWVGPAPKDPEVKGPAAASPTSSTDSGSTAPPLGTLPSTGTAPGEPSATPVLPTFSVVANPAGLTKLTVQITVTSDSPIAFFAYVIRGGKPPSHSATDLKSPTVITATGYSNGLVTRVLAEAGPVANFITCTVRVDGVLKYTSTGHGGYSFAACQG